MKKQNIITWIILLVLTVAAGLISGFSYVYTSIFILLFSTLKFVGVAFNFMEMRKANQVWQVLLIAYLIIFNTIVITLFLN